MDNLLSLMEDLSGACQRRFGGAEGNRTPDLVIANDALSHLSYGPVTFPPGLGPGSPLITMQAHGY